MKKIVALLLALVMVFGLVACGNSGAENSKAPEVSKAPEASKAPDASKAPEAETVEITLWTYPIGGWGQEDQVKVLTDAFYAETGIKVKVEYLAYADGDDKVNSAITAGGTPDLIIDRKSVV